MDVKRSNGMGRARLLSEARRACEVGRRPAVVGLPSPVRPVPKSPARPGSGSDKSSVSSSPLSRSPFRRGMGRGLLNKRFMFDAPPSPWEISNSAFNSRLFSGFETSVLELVSNLII